MQRPQRPQYPQTYSLPFRGGLGRGLLILLLVMFCSALTAQDIITISGTVTDRQTHQPLPHASVSAEMVGTVTNEQGRFTLKLKPETKALTVSLIGYRSQRVAIDGDGQQLDIRLQPTAVTLNEVVVRYLSAEDIVRAAIAKFYTNYSLDATSYKGFYREVMQKRRKYISISEAVVDLYKMPYDKDILFDAVAIQRGRRMINIKSTDTLAVKLKGGPTLPIFADVVKNEEFLFYPEDLSSYRYIYEGDEKLDERSHYVIRMVPEKGAKPYALFYATLYIDQQSLAISRADLQLDLRNRAQATNTILVHHPKGLRFTPLELSFNIFYRTEGGITHLSYIRNVMRFKCDWHRRLFASPFTVVSEFVVTDRLPEAVPIRGRDTFRSKDNLYDNVDFFDEPDFWGADNIIEPTEPLNRAIERLRRTVKQAAK